MHASNAMVEAPSYGFHESSIPSEISKDMTEVKLSKKDLKRTKIFEENYNEDDELEEVLSRYGF